MIKTTLKFLLAIALLSLAKNSSAQLRLSDNLSWEISRKQGDSFSPYFKGANYDFQYPLVPKYCQSLDINASPGTEYTVELIDLQHADPSTNDLKAISSLDPGTSPNFQVHIGSSLKGGQVSVCFYPYIKVSGNYRKITSFEIRLVPTSSDAGSAAAQSRSVLRKSASGSALASGNWYRLSLKKSGVYRITPGFLSSNGIASSAVSVQDIRILGNGASILPEVNPTVLPSGLPDVPFKVFDLNSDGIFNGNDYLVFFAKGPHSWQLNESTGAFHHELNPYRDENYYFISVNAGPGVNVTPAAPITQAASVQVTSFDDFDFEETEEYNLVGTGREWFGNLFDFDLTYSSKTFSFPNRDVSSPVRLRVRALARASSANTFMKVSMNGLQSQQLSFPAYGTGDYDPYATIGDETDNLILPGNNLVVQLEYDNSANPSGIAWLDYIQVQVRRNLDFANAPIYFRDAQIIGAGVVADYSINNTTATSGLEVWDVTDHLQVRSMSISYASGNAVIRDTANALKEYVAFTSSNIPSPNFDGAIANQDLFGAPVAEMLIVTHPDFMAAADRLARYHEEQDGISCQVVTIQQVYNEFSSGGQDIAAIRDFARLIYEKSKSDTVPFNYLLLFGDASYDYKDRLSNNTNYVPVYEGGSSLNLQSSYITDDFFAYLDPGEGDASSDFTGEIMDIGVGRIPSVTLTEAQSYVDKVVHYSSSSKRFGSWRNDVLLMADDVDEGWETMFLDNSEDLENIVRNRSAAYNVNKIYEDSYQQVNTTGSETYPEATNDMFRQVQSGNLVTNYIGHGGEIGLASEKLLGLTHVNGWTNLDAMPLFVTITCEFTRLDDPKRVSAGEQLALNPNGGAIGLISTTRTVFAGPAVTLNKAVFRELFERPNNTPKTFGEIIRDAKNELLTNATKLKFSFIGDPAVKLAIPFYRINTKTLNGKDISLGDLDTLMALNKVTVTGEVVDFSGQKLSDFSGITNVTVFDKASNKQTLRNDGVGPVLNFSLSSNLIYKGKVEVVNGDFEFSFIVPKDISLKYGNGKISLYAYSNAIDAAGYMDTAIVGGINNDAAGLDDIGPELELYMNDESFVRGGITDESPDLFAIIFDSSGVNTVGTGIGHDLLAILDDKTDQAFVLNEYYEADLNSYQRGSLRYPFFDLEEGSHTLKLRVFDVHNNFSEATTEFIVAESEDFALERVLNYPNPFTTYTEFQFEHNRASQPLEVQVQIFTVSGKLVKTINKLVMPDGNRVTGIAWNGLDDYGDKIGKGVYVYRVKVRSTLDNSSADKYEKLVILR